MEFLFIRGKTGFAETGSAGRRFSVLLEEYGRMSGKAMQLRIPSKPVYGWCRWPHYYGREMETNILANARDIIFSENVCRRRWIFFFTRIVRARKFSICAGSAVTTIF